MEEHRLRILGNRALRKIFGRESEYNWRLEEIA
jgi:hypothetical protein